MIVIHTFIGALPNQEVTLTFDKDQFTLADAVIVFPYYKEQLLFIHHKNRGWELPGGKVESGEMPIQAALRELFEEAGAEAEAIEAIGQYHIKEAGGKISTKQIYIARVSHIYPLSGAFETDQYALYQTAPSMEEIMENPKFSANIKDQVYALTLDFLSDHPFSK